MSRSLLEKHSTNGVLKKISTDLTVVPGGRDLSSRNDLTDVDWYFINSFWDSSLFNKHFMRDDFQRSRSGRLSEYETYFQTFLQKFLNLCDSKRHEKFQTFNEDQLLHSWIMPVMECLGWWTQAKDEYIPELTYTVEDESGKRTYRPDVTFLPSPKLKAAIQEKSAGERLDLTRRYVILTLEAKYWDRIRKSEKDNSDFGTKADVSKTRKSVSASSLSRGGLILTYL